MTTRPPDPETITRGNTTMTTHATAAVLREYEKPYSLDPVLLDDPGPGELVVRIVAAGHCHTDVLPRMELLGFPLPLVLGHEGAGEVVAVGPGVESVSPGDHVI